MFLNVALPPRRCPDVSFSSEPDTSEPPGPFQAFKFIERVDDEDKGGDKSVHDRAQVRRGLPGRHWPRDYSSVFLVSPTDGEAEAVVHAFLHDL